jgi:cytochrome b6-f complex iron-sulfur subunit
MTRKSGSQITRRSFCNRVLVTSAGLVISASEAASQSNHGQTLLVYPPAKIDGAERLMPGGFLYFDFPGAQNPAVLLRTKDGQYLAFSRKCAHRGCSVEFDTSQRCLACPCHRGVYDGRTGYVLYGPPPRPLDQIVLEMRAGGEVWAVGKRLGGDFNA